MEYSTEDLEYISRGNGWERAAVTLGEGDSIDNPASTKTRIYGPCTVTIDIAPDGGRNVTIS